MVVGVADREVLAVKVDLIHPSVRAALIIDDVAAGQDSGRIALQAAQQGIPRFIGVALVRIAVLPQAADFVGCRRRATVVVANYYQTSDGGFQLSGLRDRSAQPVEDVDAKVPGTAIPVTVGMLGFAASDEGDESVRGHLPAFSTYKSLPSQHLADNR